jgi:hypothetical protein
MVMDGHRKNDPPKVGDKMTYAKKNGMFSKITYNTFLA